MAMSASSVKVHHAPPEVRCWIVPGRMSLLGWLLL
jgi:hypothetical protein